MVTTRSPMPQTPPLPITKSHLPRSPRSPRSSRSPRARPLTDFAPLSSILTDEPMPTATTSAASPMQDELFTSPPKAHLLRRVLSGGSNGSTSGPSVALGTPTTGSIPLSPSSGGARTPRAKKAPLRADVDADVVMDGQPQTTRQKGQDGDGHQLATDMDGLKVQSPVNETGRSNLANPGTSMLGISQVSLSDFSNSVNSSPVKSRTPHDRSYSTSTDSSSSSHTNHPVVPAYLGGSYGPDGFPVYSGSPDESPITFNSAIPGFNGNGYAYGNGFGASSSTGNGNGNGNSAEVDPELARQAAALAAADEAVKQLNGTSTVVRGPSISGFDTQIPRNYANFIHPQQPNPTVSRQSSTSSSMTDAASTSSEESDWCIPSIEWVDTGKNGMASSPSPWPHSPYLQSPGTVFAQQKEKASAGKMMPPTSTGRGISSPRVGINIASNGHLPEPPTLHHQQSLPFGASATTPSGLRQSSALPPGVVSESAAADDDEEVTVGHARDRSPSTSSQSARSGLDLLWKAAQGNVPEELANYDPSRSDHKGKRKAGAEAVDKWRTSGIPSGVTPVSGSSERRLDIAPPKSGSAGPPRKRRRSEIKLEDAEVITEAYSTGDRDEVIDEAGSSDYRSMSGSTSDDRGSGDDSEYQGAGGGRRGRTSTGRNKAGSGAKRHSLSGNRGGTGARGKSGVNVSPAHAPGGVTKSGTIKKVRKMGESPSGSAKGGRKSAPAVIVGGVQCEYINPLPPYNRCTDVFTRKYDLPRHMARHARREGELVVEGKLADNKAVLWKSIKDKPKVTCEVCGESFTRMDALKRHMAKQHK